MKTVTFKEFTFAYNQVTNATISRCNFSDYVYPEDLNYIGTGLEALYIPDSMVVIIQSNFSSNIGAIKYEVYGFSYYYNSMESLCIKNSTFINNTSDFLGGAVFITGSYASVSYTHLTLPTILRV